MKKQSVIQLIKYRTFRKKNYFINEIVGRKIENFRHTVSKFW